MTDLTSVRGNFHRLMLNAQCYSGGNTIDSVMEQTRLDVDFFPSRSRNSSTKYSPESCDFLAFDERTLIPLGRQNSLVELDYRDDKSRLSRYRLSVRSIIDSFRKILRRQDNIRKSQTRAIDPLDSRGFNIRSGQFCQLYRGEISYRVACDVLAEGRLINEIILCVASPPLTRFPTVSRISGTDSHRVLAVWRLASPEINDIHA